MTDIIRSEAPRRSLGALLAMAGLAAGALLFTILGFMGIAFEWPQTNYINPMATVTFWFGMVFLLLAVFLEVYRREFVPDELSGSNANIAAGLNWVLQKNLQFQVVHVTDFKLWDGASTLWREAFDEGGKAVSGTGFPALIICVEASLLEVPTEFESYVVRRDVGGVPAVFIALYDRCVHLCCKPGWHYNVVPSTLHDYVTQPRTLLASPPQDPIWCQCHNSQYDPVTIVSDIHPPPANVPYIGARFVHGPATRALPCIPLKLNGTILEGIYDPGDGGHPEWYSAYC